MQTLFNKKNKLIKKNKILTNSFFINLMLITLTLIYTRNGMKFLIMKLFPFMNTFHLSFLVLTLIISDLLIILNVKNNEELIKEIENKIEYELSSNSNKNNIYDEVDIKYLEGIYMINKESIKDKIKVKTK